VPTETLLPDPAFEEVSDGSESLRERVLQWLMDHDIPLQAVAGAAGLVVLLAVIAVVLILGRLGADRAGDTSSAAAAVATPTSVLPTSASTTVQTATPTPAPTVARSDAATSGTPASSLFRFGRPETPPATPGTNAPDQSEGNSLRPIVVQPAPTVQSPPLPDGGQPMPWITATPQNLGASGAGNSGQLVILNPAPSQSTRSGGDQPLRPPVAFGASSSAESRTAGTEPVSAAPAPPPPPPPPPPTPPPPKLTVSAASVDFAKGETVKTVTISNAGEGQFSWRATPQQVWILVTPSGGTVSSNATLQIRVDRELAGLGSRSGAITVSSDAGSVVITVNVQ
jgi:hypothetical protein